MIFFSFVLEHRPSPERHLPTAPGGPTGEPRNTTRNRYQSSYQFPICHICVVCCLLLQSAPITGRLSSIFVETAMLPGRVSIQQGIELGSECIERNCTRNVIGELHCFCFVTFVLLLARSSSSLCITKVLS